MEQLNMIEILGTVGNVRIHEVGNSRVARVSVATDYAYKDRSGANCIEVTWHSVSIWERPDAKDSIDKLTKGCHIHVFGRLRSNRYTDDAGIDHSFMEIYANKWEIA